MKMQVHDVQIHTLREYYPGEVQTVRHWLLGTGILTIVLGTAAVLLPFLATLTVEVFLGVILTAAGVLHILMAFASRRVKGLLLRLVAGILYGVLGILLLVFPLRGVFTLTVLLALFFMVTGAYKIALSFHLRPVRSWGWLLFSGLLAGALGILIWMGLPGAAAWAIGLLVGIELVFSGWAMVMFALSIRRDDQKETEKEMLPREFVEQFRGS